MFGIRPKAESQLACIVIGVGASCCQVFILLHDSDSNCWVVRGAWVMRVQLCKISLTESLMEIMTVAWSRGLTNARLRATLFFHDVNPNQRVDRFVSDVRPDTHAHCASGPTRLASFAFLYLLPREHSFAMQKLPVGGRITLSLLCASSTTSFLLVSRRIIGILHFTSEKVCLVRSFNSPKI